MIYVDINTGAKCQIVKLRSSILPSSKNIVYGDLPTKYIWIYSKYKWAKPLNRFLYLQNR